MVRSGYLSYSGSNGMDLLEKSKGGGRRKLFRLPHTSFRHGKPLTMLCPTYRKTITPLYLPCLGQQHLSVACPYCQKNHWNPPETSPMSSPTNERKSDLQVWRGVGGWDVRLSINCHPIPVKGSARPLKPGPSFLKSANLPTLSATHPPTATWPICSTPAGHQAMKGENYGRIISFWWENGHSSFIIKPSPSQHTKDMEEMKEIWY